MQHLALCPEGKTPFRACQRHCSPGKVPRVYRIKPHAPPLVRAPVNSFEFHSCERTPQVDHLSLSLGHQTEVRTSSDHRLRRGLPGYLILFATHAFVPQCQLRYRDLPSQSVFCVISMHFTATPHIPVSSNVLKCASINGVL